jgi:hypothetical protein
MKRERSFAEIGGLKGYLSSYQENPMDMGDMLSREKVEKLLEKLARIWIVMGAANMEKGGFLLAWSKDENTGIPIPLNKETIDLEIEMLKMGGGSSGNTETWNRVTEEIEKIGVIGWDAWLEEKEKELGVIEEGEEGGF